MKRKDYGLDDLATIAKVDIRSCLENSVDRFLAIGAFDTMYQNAASYFFMTDYYRMDYSYISKSVKNVLGHTQRDFKSRGYEFMFQCIHPDDRARLQQIHEEMFRFYYAASVSDRKDLKFNTNYRVKRNDGTYLMILQETIVTEISPTGHPIADFCTCTDISGYNKENSLQLIIYQKQHYSYQKVYEYKISDQNDLLTNRQIEILNLLSKGFTTPQIAEMLFLSEETIKIHRKNILQRTGAKNSIEAVKLILGG